MFLCFRPILFPTFFNSLICIGSLIEKFYIQTVPGTKHHRFLVSLIVLKHLSFFGHNKRLRRVEHLQRKETISSEPYFSTQVGLTKGTNARAGHRQHTLQAQQAQCTYLPVLPCPVIEGTLKVVLKDVLPEQRYQSQNQWCRYHRTNKL